MAEDLKECAHSFNMSEACLSKPVRYKCRKCDTYKTEYEILGLSKEEVKDINYYRKHFKAKKNFGVAFSSVGNVCSECKNIVKQHTSLDKLIFCLPCLNYEEIEVASEVEERMEKELEEYKKKSIAAYNKFVSSCDDRTLFNLDKFSSYICSFNLLGFVLSLVSNKIMPEVFFMVSSCMFLASCKVADLSIKQAMKDAKKYYIERDDSYFNKESNWTKATKLLNILCPVFCIAGAISLMISF